MPLAVSANPVDPWGLGQLLPYIQPSSAPGGAPAADAGGGGYSGGGSYSADPYAQWGGRAGYDKALGDYNAQKGNTMGSITDRINTEGSGYGSTITDFLENLGAGQKKVDSQSVQNELSKRQGTSGVLDMIGRGVRSGGVMLANKNATNSSATEALGRAYGDIGRRQLSGVGNQYEQGKLKVQSSQDDLDLQRSQGVRHLGENKTNIINGIVTDAQNALASLNQAAANASLPDRIDIEVEKQRIRNEALGKLQAFDTQLNTGVANIKPSDQMTNMTKAAQMDTAGTAADDAFNFSSSIPAQFQGTGPFASDLPLFQYPNGKKDPATAGV